MRNRKQATGEGGGEDHTTCKLCWLAPKDMKTYQHPTWRCPVLCRAAFWLPGPELCRRSGVKGAAAVGISERRGLDPGFADDVL